MSKNIKWALVLLLWIYIIRRAYTVPITHDEAYSFFMVKTNAINAMIGTANNHWLNSLCMKLGTLFSNHPFALRLFSVLSWLVYGYSAIQISERLRNVWAGFALLLALTLNPFLLDFFSLARGYGMACAFELAAIGQIIRILEKKEWHSAAWVPAMTWASLSVFANYTSLYFFLSVVGAYIVFLLLGKQWKQFRTVFTGKWFWIVNGTAAISIANLLFIKFYTGDLEYGGRSGFVDSLFGSLVRGSLYMLWNDQVSVLLTYAVLALVTISLITAALQYFRYKRITPFLFLAACLLAMLLLNVFFYIVLKTPYLFRRTTLVFYPLIVIVLFEGIRQLRFSLSVKKHISLGLGALLMVAFSMHFFYSFNTKYCYEWKEQADTKEGLAVLVNEKAKQVLVHRLHSGTLTNYYRITDSARYSFTSQSFYNRDLESLLFQNVSNHQYDHALLLPPYDLQALRQKHISFTVLKHYPVSGAIVLRLDTLNHHP